jgi:hypothetical protein
MAIPKTSTRSIFMSDPRVVHRSLQHAGDGLAFFFQKPPDTILCLHAGKFTTARDEVTARVAAASKDQIQARSDLGAQRVCIYREAVSK